MQVTYVYYLKTRLCAEIRRRIDEYDKEVIVKDKRRPDRVEYLSGWMYNKGDRWVRMQGIKFYRDPSSLTCYNHLHRVVNNNETVGYVYMPRTSRSDKDPVTINNKLQPRYVFNKSYEGVIKDMCVMCILTNSP